MVALIVLLAVYPLLRSVFDGRLLFDALLTLVFVSAFLALFDLRSIRVVSVMLAVPTLLGAWTRYALPGVPHGPLAVGLNLAAALFLVFGAAAILRAVYSGEVVSADGVYGAFCGYLLVGVAFAHVYCVVELLVPGSFAGKSFAAPVRDEGQLRFL